MSGLPSLFKSAATRAVAKYAAIGEPCACAKFTAACGTATGKYTKLELPPPGDGFTTVIVAVPAVAIADAGTSAVSCRLFTKVVERAVPFKFTVAPERKPAPFTVRVKPGPPGPAASVTCASKYHVPPPLGVPVIAPVPALMLRPLGSEPMDTDQVNGGVPPISEMVWL